MESETEIREYADQAINMEVNEENDSAVYRLLRVLLTDYHAREIASMAEDIGNEIKDDDVMSAGIATIRAALR